MPTYTLITVTNGGQVHHTKGFESLRMCQEARSIALYGMTIEEKRTLDAVQAEMQRRSAIARLKHLDALWREQRPPRPPNAHDRQQLKKLQLAWAYKGPRIQLQLHTSHYDGISAELTGLKFADDGLIHELFNQCGAWSSGTSNTWTGPDHYLHRGSPTDIRSAHCVIEMPDEPEAPLSALMPRRAA